MGTSLRRLQRERDDFARILQMPQTRFPYRQRLRAAIARRDRAIQRLMLMMDPTGVANTAATALSVRSRQGPMRGSLRGVRASAARR